MTRKQYRNSKPARESRPPAFIAWHVDEKGEKKFWTRIGAAWDHKDGEGFTLQLDLVPVNGGRIILRAPREDEEDQAEAGPAATEQEAGA
jgi:hypothetical protein